MAKWAYDLGQLFWEVMSVNFMTNFQPEKEDFHWESIEKNLDDPIKFRVL